MNSIWLLNTYDDHLAQKISTDLNISLVLARLLVQRGITSPQVAKGFLNPHLDNLLDPLVMNGMQAAVDRIHTALNKAEKIIIYGDYDVDGICSVVILKECLQRLGYNADYYVPNRFQEGYGLNNEAIRELAGRGYKLIITVDCGISSVEETELARQLGVDLIITDHHTPASVQPNAIAIINPKNDKIPAINDLAGVGVAYKLACALLNIQGEKFGQDWLELVALATVADIVPLTGENRILVKYGLKALEKTQRPGLQALLNKTSLCGKELEAWHVGFILAPRLNSAGRLDSARTSIELLLSRNESEAEEIAARLCALNEERKKIEDCIYRLAVADIEGNKAHIDNGFILTGGEHWHEGVIGIVASRLTNHYNRPAIVISWDGDKGKASARSAANINLYQALTYCQNTLEKFGGHKMAAGLSLKKENLPAFAQAFQEYLHAEELGSPDAVAYHVDLELDQADINLQLVNEIKLLSPFGEGNPVPQFILRAGDIHEPALVGAQKEHFKCKTGSSYLEAIAFNRSDFMTPVIPTCKQDMIFELSENTFRERTRIQLKIKDMKSSCCPDHFPGQDNNSRQLSAALQRTAQELNRGYPVLFVYPGYRSLNKHIDLLQGMLKADRLQELHGMLPSRQRDFGQKQFASGQAKLYLTTQAFINYYCAHYRLPEKLGYVVVLWPHEKPQIKSFLNIDTEIFIINNHQPEFLITSPDWIIPPIDRTVIYANRPSTIKNLYQSHNEMVIESGLTDVWQRLTVRKRFINTAAGMFLFDGTHPRGLAPMGRIDNFILADSPFGHYELAAVADYWEEVEIPLRLSFTQQDLQKNWTYLERIYPEGELVEAVWHELRRQTKIGLKTTQTELLIRLKATLGRQLHPRELISTLEVLADLGLCQFAKSGSIMEIKPLPTDMAKLSLQESPYYLEGREEKNLLARWEQSINNNLVW